MKGDMAITTYNTGTARFEYELPESARNDIAAELARIAVEGIAFYLKDGETLRYIKGKDIKYVDFRRIGNTVVDRRELGFTTTGR